MFGRFQNMYLIIALVAALFHLMYPLYKIDLQFANSKIETVLELKAVEFLSQMIALGICVSLIAGALILHRENRVQRRFILGALGANLLLLGVTYYNLSDHFHGYMLRHFGAGSWMPILMLLALAMSLKAVSDEIRREKKEKNQSAAS